MTAGSVVSPVLSPDKENTLTRGRADMIGGQLSIFGREDVRREVQ
jgi:hypothetical protein